jgi:hypothetical protein
MISPEDVQLLQQGFREYVHALNALEAFRELVRFQCRSVLTENLTEFGSALGVKLSIEQTEPHDYRIPSQHDEVGVKCKLGGHPAIWIGLSVEWSHEDRGGYLTGLTAWVWSDTSRNVRRLAEILRKKRIQYDGLEGQSLWLYDSMNSDDVANINTRLNALMKRWIKLWRKVDGIKALRG